MTIVRIATRTSDLALAQARMMAGELERVLGVATELVPLKTTGDRLHWHGGAGHGGGMQHSTRQRWSARPYR